MTSPTVGTAEHPFNIDVVQQMGQEGLVIATTNPVTGGIDFLSVSDVKRQLAPLLPYGSRASYLDGIGNSIVAGWGLFWDRFCKLSSGRFTAANNFGVSGNTSAMIFARLNTILSSASRSCIYIEGVNDAALGVSDADHISNTVAIHKALLAAGKSVLHVMAPPSNANPSATEKNNVIDWYICRALGIPAVQPWASGIDPSTGGYSSISKSSDGVHPTGQLAQDAAAEMVAWLNSVAPPHIPLPQSNVGSVSYALHASNPLFLTDTNADGLPDSWVKTGTGTISLVSDGVRGNWMKVSQSGASVATSSHRDVSSGFDDGDEVLLVCRVKLEDMSNCHATLSLQDNSSSPLKRTFWFNSMSENTSEQIVFMRHATSNPMTSLRVIVQVAPAVAGNFSGSISVAQLQIYNLTRLKAITGLEI